MNTTARLLALFGCSIVLSACDLCANEVSQTVLSPSGKLKAVVFNRDCGATTGFNTQVSIMPVAASLPDSGGNILVIDGAVPLHLTWRSDALLSLRGVGAARVVRKSHSAAGVSVDYGA
jgi:hypothetical protein